jgi:hypothetical protein
MTKEKRKHSTLLMRELNFTEEDLEANHQGYLSEHQERRLVRQHQITVFVALFVIVGTLTTVCGGSVVSDLPDFSDTYLLWVIVVGVTLVIFFGCVFALCWGAVVQRERDYDVDGSEGKPTRISGILSKHLDFGKRNEGIYRVQIADKIFSVNGGVHQAFEEGQNYLIYYTARTNKILSAEVVQDDA